jgi:hypothetical protein
MLLKQMTVIEGNGKCETDKHKQELSVQRDLLLAVSKKNTGDKLQSSVLL